MRKPDLTARENEHFIEVLAELLEMKGLTNLTKQKLSNDDNKTNVNP